MLLEGGGDFVVSCTKRSSKELVMTAAALKILEVYFAIYIEIRKHFGTIAHLLLLHVCAKTLTSAKSALCDVTSDGIGLLPL